MNVQTMIYIYLIICVSLIIFNIAYVFFLSRSSKKLGKYSQKFESLINEQAQRIANGEEVEEKHKEYLQKKLVRVSKLLAFDKCMEKMFEEDRKKASTYLAEVISVFVYLSTAYKRKNAIHTAFFPYILAKYDIIENFNSETVSSAMFDMLYSKNVYVRENALKAIYSICDSDMVIHALKIISDNDYFHHPKLVCDGLAEFKGDKVILGRKMLDNFDIFSVDMQVNILNYLRFRSVRNDEFFFNIMTDEKMDKELRFACIRYFEKFPCDFALETLWEFASDKVNPVWEYRAIASSALKSYPCDKTFDILISNLSSSNWYIRLNSAISCEKLGYSYDDLIDIFEGNDRYAREMIRYRLDHRKAIEEVNKV